MRPLVIVRPKPGADATASAAETLGLEVIVMPLFAIEAVDWQAPDAADYDALLLTSANVLRYGGSQLEKLRTLPVHCVGEATASAAREAGFTVRSIGASGVDALLETVPKGLRLLHLCGADRREPRDPRRAIEAISVYAARELPVAERLAQLGGSVVAVHSPRAAATFSSAAERVGLGRETVAIAAISEDAAKAAGSGWERVESASEPTDPALLALAAQLCNNPR